MNRPKTAAARIAAEFDVAQRPTPLLDVLVQIGIELGWFVEQELSEITETCAAIKKPFSDALRRELNSARSDNRTYRFEFNSSDPDLIQGYCFVEGNESPELQAIKLARLDGANYADAIRRLSPRDLELTCRGVLSVLGCSHAVVTQRTRDEGIDFFGRLELEGKLGDALEGMPGVERDLNVWLVGQAKHYTGAASTPELRNLAGAVELARAAVYSDDGSALKDLRLRVFDPVVYLFITSGTLSRDFRALAKRSGIVAMDGSMLSSLLADRGVGLVDGSFDSSAFSEWVADQEAS